MELGLKIPISTEYQQILSQKFEDRLLQGEASKTGKPTTRYALTNPIRFVELRSRQTWDVSERVGAEERLPMFGPLDQGLAVPIGGDDVLTPEPLLQGRQPIDAGVSFAIYGGYFQYNSAADNTAVTGIAQSRLFLRAMRGSFAELRYTNRRQLGPWTCRWAGDAVNKEDLASGVGAVATDAGVDMPDYRINVNPNPLIIWPQAQVDPRIVFNGSNAATFGLTFDFQLIWVLLCMTANVQPIGR